MTKQEQTKFKKYLKILCDHYDRTTGAYPEHECEGQSVYTHFIDCIDELQKEFESNDTYVKCFYCQGHGVGAFTDKCHECEGSGKAK